MTLHSVAARLAERWCELQMGGPVEDAYENCAEELQQVLRNFPEQEATPIESSEEEGEKIPAGEMEKQVGHGGTYYPEKVVHSWQRKFWELARLTGNLSQEGYENMLPPTLESNKDLLEIAENFIRTMEKREHDHRQNDLTRLREAVTEDVFGHVASFFDAVKHGFSGRKITVTVEGEQ